MHQLYFVAVKENNQDPQTAKDEAQELLDLNNFCNSNGGYFSNSKGDWYEIGGRWADFLVRRFKWAESAYKEIDEYLNRPENLRKTKGGKPEKYTIRGTSYGSDKEKKKQEELRERCEMIWGKHRPSEYPKVPFDRWYNDGNVFGKATDWNADSAVLLDDEVVEYLRNHNKKNKEQDTLSGFGGLEVFVQEEIEDSWGEEWLLRDWINEIDKNPKEHIEKYWLVAIDYHN